MPGTCPNWPLSTMVDEVLLTTLSIGLLIRVFPLAFFKVGHSLRDRTDLVAQHLALKLKTRDELLRDGIPLMDYVERVTPSWHEHEVVVFGLTYPRGSHSNNQDHALQAKIHRPTKKQRTSTGQHSRDIAAASYLLNLSSKSHQSSRRSGAVDYMSRNGEVPTRITEMNSSALLGRAEEVFANAEVAMRMTVQEKDVRTQHETYGAQGIAGHNIGARPTIEGIPNTVGSRKEAIARRPLQKSTRLGSSTQVQPRYFMSLADIVVPTLQNGSELLPIPGNWKFFPSPEFRSKKVDLGTQAKGWSLRLVPQASEEESILLPVPARLIVNGCQKQGQASAADSV